MIIVLALTAFLQSASATGHGCGNAGLDRVSATPLARLQTLAEQGEVYRIATEHPNCARLIQLRAGRNVRLDPVEGSFTFEHNLFVERFGTKANKTFRQTKLSVRPLSLVREAQRESDATLEQSYSVWILSRQATVRLQAELIFNAETDAITYRIRATGVDPVTCEYRRI